MSFLKLRLTMVGTLVLIITVSTLFFTAILTLIGNLNILTLAFIVILFNFIQWLLAPMMIDALYRVREVSKSENPRLHGVVERLSQKIGLKTPKVMVANLPVPNAFAYSSPVGGSRVAVTNELLRTLEDEEVEAVVGHELGHLKHRDVQVMMFVSVLPAIFYFIGYSMLLPAWYGGYGTYRSRNREGSAIPILVGLGSIAIYWILTLCVLGLSRQREYYADRRSCMIVEDGARKLSEGLAKIVSSTGRMKRSRERGGLGSLNSFKALFIADPDRAERDVADIARFSRQISDQQLVRDILSRKLTTKDRILELFSTHPNIMKRLRALQTFPKT